MTTVNIDKLKPGVETEGATMTQTRRNFLKAAVAFCAALLAVHRKAPETVEIYSQQVDLESYIVEAYTKKHKKWLNEQLDSEAGLLISR